MKAEDLRAYTQRSWDQLAALKDARWRERRERLGPVEGFRLAGELYDFVKRTRPDWPSSQSRLTDLEHHARLAQKLRAVV